MFFPSLDLTAMASKLGLVDLLQASGKANGRPGGYQVGVVERGKIRPLEMLETRFASSNKCHASSNKCLTSSNKKRETKRLCICFSWP